MPSVEIKEQQAAGKEKIMAGGKLATSKIPPLHLIPTRGLEKLAERFALGVERKGDKAWNALTDNQDALADVQFAIDRCGHVIHHALKLRDKLASGDFAGLEADDDASAITWGGMLLAHATEAILNREKSNTRS
jgi:hypothetical protein